MKFYPVLFLVFVSSLLSCKHEKEAISNEKENQVFQNKGHKLVYEMTQKVGDYQALLNLKDVVYTYTYQTPDTKKDVSIEKYIFDGELSLGLYQLHERTIPELEGSIEQSYNGKEFWLKHNGTKIQNEEYLKKTMFNRKTNFYWFAMFQKMLDPGLNYEFIKEESIADKKYDIVKVSFDSVGGKPTDIYQLYINQETKLVDQFLFTVVDFNVTEFPLLMQVEYQEVEGVFIPTKRQYKPSTWDGHVSDEPWIKVTWSDIKFNTNLSKSEFD